MVAERSVSIKIFGLVMPGDEPGMTKRAFSRASIARERS
jgi:hypothetical protein